MTAKRKPKIVSVRLKDLPPPDPKIIERLRRSQDKDDLKVLRMERTKALATCRDALALLEAMERDRALRLPYPDYEEVMEALRALVED